MNEILFIEYHEDDLITDKPHCSGCDPLPIKHTDKPHCSGCDPFPELHQKAQPFDHTQPIHK